MNANPFTIYSYTGPDYFCDRNVELSRLLEMFDNQRYTLMYSMRRLGKTGLVHHFHHSQRHLLLGLFSDARKPFFGAVEQIQLQLLEKQIYSDFIVQQFEHVKRRIKDEAVSEVLEWTRSHTFYTQYVCNTLFARAVETITLYDVEQVKNAILFSFEPSYLTLKSVLSINQFKLLIGIAREGGVTGVTGVSSSAFLSIYGLAQSSALQALQVLLNKELLYEELRSEGSRFIVYDTDDSAVA